MERTSVNGGAGSKLSACWFSAIWCKDQHHRPPSGGDGSRHTRRPVQNGPRQQPFKEQACIRNVTQRQEFARTNAQSQERAVKKISAPRGQICFCEWLALMAFSARRRKTYGRVLAVCVVVHLIPPSVFQRAADDSPSPAPVEEGRLSAIALRRRRARVARQGWIWPKTDVRPILEIVALKA